jgi:hypothetical protein
MRKIFRNKELAVSRFQNGPAVPDREVQDCQRSVIILERMLFSSNTRSFPVSSDGHSDYQ